MNTLKTNPTTEPSGFRSVIHTALKILLKFITGLVGSLVFCILSALIAFSGPRPSYAFGQEEFFFGDVLGFLIPITFAFGSLFGIWVTLQILHEKTNYLYLTLIAAVLCLVEFLTIQYAATVNAKFGWLFIFGIPLVLAIAANAFISKQSKIASVVKPTSFKNTLKARIILQFIAGTIGSVLGSGFGLAISLLFLCVPQEENLCPNLLAGFVAITTAYLGALFGIWAISKLMRYKTNYLHLFIAEAIILALQLAAHFIFSEEASAQFSGALFLFLPLLLVIVANVFTPKPTNQDL